MNPGRPLERRTPLRVVTPMKRGQPLARDRQPRGPSSATPRRRPKDTGPSPATRTLVLDRAGGRCEISGHLLHDGTRWVAEHSIHHRRPRRMGGSSDPATNATSNLLLLCGSATSTTGCHLLVESQRVMALSMGWLLHDGEDPTGVAVELHTTPQGHRTVLDDQGGATHTTDWRHP